MDDSKQHLNPPTVPSVRYKSNFIKTAVCELRFPTILELDRRAPSEFQAKVRKHYPFYEGQVIEQMGAPEEILKERRYLFRSKDIPRSSIVGRVLLPFIRIIAATNPIYGWSSPGSAYIVVQWTPIGRRVSASITTVQDRSSLALRPNT